MQGWFFLVIARVACTMSVIRAADLSIGAEWLVGCGNGMRGRGRDGTRCVIWWV